MLTLILTLALMGSYKYISSYSTVSSNVNGKEMPICSVETEEKKVALTFDVAWGNENMEKILNILKSRDVRATFFVTGKWAEDYPEDVKSIQAAGHELGNHSENHRNMTQLSEEEQKEEVMAAHQKVQNLTGVTMQLFRLPYEAYEDAVIRNIQACGYYPIEFSVDSQDWKEYGRESIIREVLENDNLENGAIIRCHSEAKYTADSLEELIDKIQDKGYRLVTVSDLIYKEPYHLDVTGRQIAD